MKKHLVSCSKNPSYIKVNTATPLSCHKWSSKRAINFCGRWN